MLPVFLCLGKVHVGTIKFALYYILKVWTIALQFSNVQLWEAAEVTFRWLLTCTGRLINEDSFTSLLCFAVHIFWQSLCQKEEAERNKLLASHWVPLYWLSFHYIILDFTVKHLIRLVSLSYHYYTFTFFYSKYKVNTESGGPFTSWSQR